MATSGQGGSSKPKKTFRAIVKMTLPRSIPKKILLLQGIIQCIADNIYFINISPAIGEANDRMETLLEKQALTYSRTIGTAADRDAALFSMLIIYYAWKAYVQMIADLDPQNSITIIESSGFKVRKARVHEKQILKVIKGKAPATAKLMALSLERTATYEWQWSADGENWVNFKKTTSVANTTKSDLKSGVVYYFRWRGGCSKIETDWCDPVAFVRL